MPEPVEILSVEGLGKDFALSSGVPFVKGPIVKAVSDVSFSINAGDVVSLVGESGSGKTTIARMIVLLNRITRGKVQYEGKDISGFTTPERESFKRKVQMIFQDPYASLNPRMKVRDLLTEGRLVHHLGTRRENAEFADDLIHKVGLDSEHLDRYPHEFSGGQRQRIGIARALSIEPSFIVADEPVSALDVSIQIQVLNLLKDLQEQMNLTMLMIAHDLGVVEYVSNKVIVLYLGNIVEMGHVSDIFSNPKHPYTQALLDSVPIPNPKQARSRKRQILRGDIPSPINPPSGCVFRTRCPMATKECAEVKPHLKNVSTTHQHACLKV